MRLKEIELRACSNVLTILGFNSEHNWGDLFNERESLRFDNE
jgi:hypothetical protein